MPRYRVESGFRVAIVEASSPRAAVVLAERIFSAAARRTNPLGRPPLSEVVEVVGEREWIDPWKVQAAAVDRPGGVP